MRTDPTILVTGANKGIGYSICKELYLSHPTCQVVMTARDRQRGENARGDLIALFPAGEPRLSFCTLDLADANSILGAVSYVSRIFGELDILINNAAVCIADKAFDPQVARQTLGVNVFGTRDVFRAFLPLLREGGRIVNVSSKRGLLSEFGPNLRPKFLADPIVESEVINLMHSFIAGVDLGTWHEQGWPRDVYGVSKAGLTAMTRAWALELDADRRGIVVHACCPGWCRTDMGGDKATRSADEGADTPVWLALELATPGQGQDRPSGRFFFDREPVDKV